MRKVTYQHVDPDGSFGFHKVGGELVEITATSRYATDDPAEIAWLDTVRFVKRAGKTGGGGEA